MLYVLKIAYFSKAFTLSKDIERIFFYFSSEVDTLAQFTTAINRFTALMMPLKQERMLLNDKLFQIWSPMVSTWCCILIICLSALSVFIQVQMYSSDLSVLLMVYNSHKLFLIICSLIIIFIPIFKSLYKSKSDNSNSKVDSLSDTNLRKQRAEKQLLYETIFICFWKGINLVANTIYPKASFSLFYMDLILTIIDCSLFISNVGGFIVLLFISSAVRKGFKKAFWMEKDGGSVSTVSTFTVAKKTRTAK
ncbi:hypothetical protein FO519_009819 [Halicephalobus sp. NKZ332]|nr:hypothetical protein FO519_009819 [Halicephalobus sp. NKZ332]